MRHATGKDPQKFPLPRYLRESSEIAGPEGTRATIRKIGRNDFHLIKHGVTDHSRFGPADHIREDIAHFLETGSLPRGEQW